MSREAELAKNTIIISIGTFLPKMASLITLPILTYCLTKFEYGTYDLILTLVELLLPIATLKIDTAAFRFLIERRGDNRECAAVSSTILAFLIPVSFTVVIALYFALYMLSPLNRILIPSYLFLNIILISLQMISRGLSHNMLYSLSAIINSVLSMALIVLFVKMMSYGLEGVLISLIIAQIVTILFIFVTTDLFSILSLKYVSKDLLKEMIGYAWPMIPNSLSLWIMDLSDRLIIAAVLGIESNAIYAVARKIPNLFGTVQGTFSYAWQENASIAVKDSDSKEYYSSMFDTFFCILVGIMALSIAFTPIMFVLLIHGDYMEAYYQMPILFGGVFFSALSSFLGGIYIAHKKTKSVGLTTIAAAATNFLINIIFVKVIGLYAASTSTFISYVLLVIYRMNKIKAFQPIEFKPKKIIFYLSILIFMGLICYQNNSYLNVFNIIFGMVFAVFTNKKQVKIIWRIYNKKIKR